jgi:hypothetical protein
VYAADGQHVEMEEVYSFFHNKNCPALQVTDNKVSDLSFFQILKGLSH